MSAALFMAAFALGIPLAHAQPDGAMPAPLSALSPAVDGAQTVVTEESREPIASGIERSTYVRTARQSLVEGSWVSIDHDGGRAHLSMAVAGRGPWNSVALDDWAKRAGVAVAMSVVQAPDRGESPWIDGLMFVDGELLGWPPTGPVLRLAAEGHLAAMPPPPATPLLLLLEDGAEPIALAGVNCALGDEPILLTGEFPGNHGNAIEWPDGTVAVRLSPVVDNKAPAQSIWDRSRPPAAREWLVDRPTAASRVMLDRRQVAVVVPPAAAAACAALLQGRDRAVLDIDLPLDVRLSIYAITTGGLTMANGKPAQADSTASQLPPRSWIATDDDGGRVWLAEFDSPRIEDSGLATSQLVAEFANRGALHALELRPAAKRYFAAPLPGEAVSMASAPRARFAALAMPKPVSLTLAHAGPVRALRVLTTATDPVQADSRPLRGLTDRRTGIDAALDHFWWAELPSTATLPADDGAINVPTLHAIQLRLEPQRKVAAIDLIHAEVVGFSPQFNLRGWRLLGRPDPTVDWQPIETQRLAQPVARQRVVVDPPRPLAELRLEVTHPNFVLDGRTARLAEIVVWGQ